MKKKHVIIVLLLSIVAILFIVFFMVFLHGEKITKVFDVDLDDVKEISISEVHTNSFKLSKDECNAYLKELKKLRVRKSNKRAVRNNLPDMGAQIYIIKFYLSDNTYLGIGTCYSLDENNIFKAGYSENKNPDGNMNIEYFVPLNKTKIDYNSLDKLWKRYKSE